MRRSQHLSRRLEIRTSVTLTESCLKQMVLGPAGISLTLLPTPTPAGVRKPGFDVPAVSIELSRPAMVKRIKPPLADTPSTGPVMPADAGTFTMAIAQLCRSDWSLRPSRTGPMLVVDIRTPSAARHPASSTLASSVCENISGDSLDSSSVLGPAAPRSRQLIASSVASSTRIPVQLGMAAVIAGRAPGSPSAYQRTWQFSSCFRGMFGYNLSHGICRAEGPYRVFVW